MKQNLFFGLLILTLVVVPLFAVACEEEDVTPPAEEEEEQPPAEEEEEEEGNWWDEFGEPEYGGTLTIHANNLDNVTYDPAKMGGTHLYWLERLFNLDWTVDRDICSCKLEFVDVEYYQGVLAESWEQTDPVTYTVYLREGIYWQDKEPVNGREFTADDVVYHYDRLLGTGSGYTEPNPFFSGMLGNIEQVVATGKYTVEFRLKNPTAFGVYEILAPSMTTGVIEPREWVELAGPPSNETIGTGPLADWTTVVGTGPWMLTEVEEATSLTFSINPNYWGYDERHPENQIPYIDSLKIVAIADMPTALAAMRTGQIDMIPTSGVSWQQLDSLTETNPDIQYGFGVTTGYGVEMRCDREPFTDIRVRKALQLAIDRKAIAESYYGGTTDWKPAGLFNTAMEGYCMPYDEWSQELKDEYDYDVEAAKALLAEAAADGVFTPNDLGGFDTNCVMGSNNDQTICELARGYFMDIGVVMEIEVLPVPVFMSYVQTGEHVGMALNRTVNSTMIPTRSILNRYSNYIDNVTYNNDPHYDELVEQFQIAATIDEAKRLCKEADEYALTQHWSIVMCSSATRIFLWQPWLKGYSVEHQNSEVLGYWAARWWIDQELKK